jgi:hypothetical protein
VRITLHDRTDEPQRLTITSPAGDCTLIYRRPPILELDADQWRRAALIGDRDRAAAQSAIQAARRAQVFLGWQGIDDPQGQPIEFSQDRLLQLMLMVPAVETAVMQLTDALFSVETITGELVPPPATGTQAGESATTGPLPCCSSNSEPDAPAPPSSSA